MYVYQYPTQSTRLLSTHLFHSLHLTALPQCSSLGWARQKQSMLPPSPRWTVTRPSLSPSPSPRMKHQTFRPRRISAWSSCGPGGSCDTQVSGARCCRAGCSLQRTGCRQLMTPTPGWSSGQNITGVSLWKRLHATIGHYWKIAFSSCNSQVVKSDWTFLIYILFHVTHIQ